MILKPFENDYLHAFFKIKKCFFVVGNI